MAGGAVRRHYYLPPENPRKLCHDSKSHEYRDKPSKDGTPIRPSTSLALEVFTGSTPKTHLKRSLNSWFSVWFCRARRIPSGTYSRTAQNSNAKPAEPTMTSPVVGPW